MKKILVVLLVLFVAGGVFAQEGEWSISGSVVAGTRLDFDPIPDVKAEDDSPAVDGIGYFDWQTQNGQLGINYSRGAANVGITLHSEGDPVFAVSFSGENFQGAFTLANLIQTLSAGGGGYGWWAGRTIERLWGEYKFFNGVVTLLAAPSSPDTEYWTSDKTGTFFDTGLARPPATADGLTLVGGYLGSDDAYVDGWKTKEAIFGNGDTFTKVDHHNYLLTGANIGALNFGIILPNLFVPLYGNWGAEVGPWSENAGNANASGVKLLAHALPYTVLGVKFEQSPLEFAAQFQFKNYGIYFGGKFFAGPITVGISFTGVLDANGSEIEYDPKQIKFGGRVDYDGGAFGGGVKGFYSRVDQDVTGDEYLSIVGIGPTFFYNAIPSHLRFNLDVGFYFLNYANTANDTSKKSTVWAVQPQLFWNFLGTGATDSWWGGLDTGIIIRYRLAVADVRNVFVDDPAYNNGANFLDLIFKLSF